MTLTICNRCKSRLSNKASLYARCGLPVQKSFGREDLIVIFVVVIVAVLTISTYLFIKRGDGSTSLVQTDEHRCNDPTEAFGAANSFIEDHLESPATSRFPRYNDSDVLITLKGQCIFSIDSYVNTLGPFDAMTRKPFYVEVKHWFGTNKWELKGIIFKE